MNDQIDFKSAGATWKRENEMKEQYIVVTGDIRTGFHFFGPFNSIRAACEAMTAKYQKEGPEYCVVSLKGIEDGNP